MSPQASTFNPRMEHETVRGIREYLARKQSIIIPIGVIEQHGHHLPLNTDALIADHLGMCIGAGLGILKAPVMYQSFSGGACPGTINISPATMSLVISDMLVSLVAQGFRNFYLLLCHGGSENAVALDHALKMLLRNHSAFQNVMLALLPVWKLNSPGGGWERAMQDGDWHAGWLETSMVMALEPERVRMDALALDPPGLVASMRRHPDLYQHAEKIVDDPFVVARYSQRADVRVGVMGDPAQASPELGREIVEDMVRNAMRHIAALETAADGVYKEVPFVPEPIILK